MFLITLSTPLIKVTVDINETDYTNLLNLVTPMELKLSKSTKERLVRTPKCVATCTYLRTTQVLVADSPLF